MAARPDLFTKTFDRTVKRLGLRRVRLHDLRHPYATLALQAGVDARTVSARLGHATVAFTLDFYTKAVPQLDREAAAQIAHLIFGDDPKPVVNDSSSAVDDPGRRSRR